MPRKTDSNNPADWVFFAEEDIKGIDVLANAVTSYYLCQSKLAEALEKILKAEMIRLGWFLRKIHDLQNLLDELAARGSDLVAAAQPLVDSLAEAYFSDRYPGFDLEDPDWNQLKVRLRAVRSLLDTVKQRVEGSRGPPG